MSRKILVNIFWAGLFLFLTATPQADAQWMAGAASGVITRSEPLWMAGYTRKQPSQGKLHDLHVKALAVRDNSGSTAVIVTADLLGISLGFSNALRDEISEIHRIPREAIFFNVSHTHYGPEAFPDTYLIPVPDEWLPKIEQYREELYGIFKETISQALANLSPAELTFSSIMPAPFAVSRRFPDGEGGILYRSNPSNFYTGGHRDDIVPVLRVAEPGGRIKAILFGYACHPITLRGDILSGDYPGFAQQYIEEDYPGAIALFVQGCSGELVPNSRYQDEYAMGHGRALAVAVSRAISGPQTALRGPLKSSYEEIRLNFEPVTIEQLKEQSESGTQRAKIKADYLLEKIGRGEKLESSMPFPVQAIRFGNEMTLVGLGGETAAEYSVLIKSEYKDRFMWVAGFSNDVFSYLPTKTMLREGGYEAYDAMLYSPLPGPFSWDVEDLVIEGVRKVVSRISGN